MNTNLFTRREGKTMSTGLLPDLDAIKARARLAAAMAAKASAGPWCWSQYGSGTTNVNMGVGDDGVFLYLTRRSDGSEPQKADDAAFIAAARTDVPILASDVLYLCTENDILRSELAELKGRLGLGSGKEVSRAGEIVVA